jgi:16S rRNA (cytosine1402-N4)-methyltransferase
MRGDEEREGGPRARGAQGHVPVMLDRILALLGPALSAPSDDDVFFVDATLGLGGHSAAVLEAHPRVTLIGLDRDTTAIERAGRRLEAYSDRIHLVHAVYDELPRVLADLGISGVHAVLFDLGVSSPQLDEAERGFAYSYDAPLDMRMDRTQELTAEQVVNTYSASDLTRILRDYGEERFARRVAQAIVRERGRAPLTSTSKLVEVVRDAIPAASRRTGGHPGKRTFQALRMEVNAELTALKNAVPAALDALVVGGRIAVLAYHSLEDRIVKRAFAEHTTDTTPPGLPVPLPDLQPRFRLLTRGAEHPSDEETTSNPRAASARFRAAERIRGREGRPRGGARPLDDDPPSGRSQAGGTT